MNTLTTVENCPDCTAHIDDCMCDEELEITHAWFPTAEACNRLNCPSFEGYAILDNALAMVRGTTEKDWESLPIENVEQPIIVDTGENGVTIRAWNRLVSAARERGQDV